MVALQPSVFLRGLGFFLVTNEWIFEANFSFFFPPTGLDPALHMLASALHRQRPVPSSLGRFLFLFTLPLLGQHCSLHSIYILVICK